MSPAFDQFSTSILPSLYIRDKTLGSLATFIEVNGTVFTGNEVFDNVLCIFYEAEYAKSL